MRSSLRKSGLEFYGRLLGGGKGDRGDLQHLLRLGLLELFEALSFYLARYFTHGPHLVKVIN